ncbi:hypothetical protein LXF01_09145 [Acinetobacter sp. SH20PTE14]|nr:hypothetical protein [Acinetobacter sp. SH20PTE14]UIJ74423.1 hypothetical protein LXF01_09145 [Acinetobacter sp. SH20PTE14]
MEYFRPFPPLELIDQAEEEDAIRLAPAQELLAWLKDNYLNVGIAS